MVKQGQHSGKEFPGLLFHKQDVDRRCDHHTGEDAHMLVVWQARRICVEQQKEKKKETVAGKVIPGLQQGGGGGGTQSRSANTPLAAMPLRYTWHAVELCASLLQLFNKGYKIEGRKINDWESFNFWQSKWSIFCCVTKLTANNFILDFLQLFPHLLKNLLQGNKWQCVSLSN